jgi:predicted dehydrogenase
VNLGLFQHDVSVVWDLAPHDLSIMDHILRVKPDGVVATGGSHLNNLADMAFITVYFPGKDKMLVWNDLEPDEKIRVYDKGVDFSNGQGVYDLLVSYRSGDVWSPKVDGTEALKRELDYFLDCVMSGTAPVNDGHAGLRVVRLLEAADRSLKERGRIVLL